MSDSMTAPRTATVDLVRRLTPEALWLDLAVGPDFAHAAGQWVRLTFEVDGQPLTRTYSIASRPTGSGSIEVVLRTRRGGRFVRYLLEELRRGATVEVEGPYGSFGWPETLSTDAIVATASVGIGVARALVGDLLARGTDRAVELVYAEVHREEFLFTGELDGLAGLTTTRALAHPPEDWTGATGTLVDALPAVLDARPEASLWLAGFAADLDPVGDLLAARRFPAERLQVERFD